MPTRKNNEPDVQQPVRTDEPGEFDPDTNAPVHDDDDGQAERQLEQ